MNPLNFEEWFASPAQSDLRERLQAQCARAANHLLDAAEHDVQRNVDGVVQHMARHLVAPAFVEHLAQTFAAELEQRCRILANMNLAPDELDQAVAEATLLHEAKSRFVSDWAAEFGVANRRAELRNKLLAMGGSDDQADSMLWQLDRTNFWRRA